MLLTVQNWQEVYAKRGEHGPVYEYEPEAGTFHEASAEIWDRASGAVVEVRGE